MSPQAAKVLYDEFHRVAKTEPNDATGHPSSSVGLHLRNMRGTDGFDRLAVL